MFPRRIFFARLIHSTYLPWINDAIAASPLFSTVNTMLANGTVANSIGCCNATGGMCAGKNAAPLPCRPIDANHPETPLTVVTVNPAVATVRWLTGIENARLRSVRLVPFHTVLGDTSHSSTAWSPLVKDEGRAGAAAPAPVPPVPKGGMQTKSSLSGGQQKMKLEVKAQVLKPENLRIANSLSTPSKVCPPPSHPPCSYTVYPRILVVHPQITEDPT